jgi:2-oxoglutarate ferredoxin oxidoreductase subunit delta
MKTQTISFLPKDYQEHSNWRLAIIKDRCKGCEFCVTFCPTEILELSPEINSKGYHPPKLKDGKTMDDCAKCRFCELLCPEFAIFLEELTDEPPSSSSKG